MILVKIQTIEQEKDVKLLVGKYSSHSPKFYSLSVDSFYR